MPSLTYGLSFFYPGKSFSWFVVLSVKSSGTSPSQERTNSPSSEWVAATALVPAAAAICLRFGFSAARLDSAIHDAQSFRNQSVGRRCSSAESGPRLAARNLHQDVFRTGFGILNKHVEISVLIENAGVEEFILHLVP